MKQNTTVSVENYSKKFITIHEYVADKNSSKTLVVHESLYEIY